MQCYLINAHVTHENITPIRTHRQLTLPGPLPPPRPTDKGAEITPVLNWLPREMLCLLHILCIKVSTCYATGANGSSNIFNFQLPQTSRDSSFLF